MMNLLIIVCAKTLLLALVTAWARPGGAFLARAFAIAYGIGAGFGLAFFALFYLLVPAIGYHADLTWGFVAVNAVLSYGATAATVALLPMDLSVRETGAPLKHELVYYSLLSVLCIVSFILIMNNFVRALAIGATLMSAAEVVALWRGYSGPVSRMLHGEFRPLAGVLVAAAGLGIFYESANLAFPVWDWVTLAGLPEAARAGLMMAVGYIVLIHPLFVVVRLFVPAPVRRATGPQRPS